MLTTASIHKILYFGKNTGAGTPASGDPSGKPEKKAKVPKRKLSEAEKESFRRRDEKASRIRTAWPRLLKILFPMPDNGEIKHGFVRKARDKFHETVERVGGELPAHEAKKIFDAGKTSRLHQAEAAFLQQMDLLDGCVQNLRNYLRSEETLVRVLGMVPAGRFKDELILGLLHRNHSPAAIKCLKHLSGDEARVRAVRFIVSNNLAGGAVLVMRHMTDRSRLFETLAWIHSSGYRLVDRHRGDHDLKTYLVRYFPDGPLKDDVLAYVEQLDKAKAQAAPLDDQPVSIIAMVSKSSQSSKNKNPDAKPSQPKTAEIQSAEVQTEAQELCKKLTLAIDDQARTDAIYNAVGKPLSPAQREEVMQTAEDFICSVPELERKQTLAFCYLDMISRRELNLERTLQFFTRLKPDSIKKWLIDDYCNRSRRVHPQYGVAMAAAVFTMTKKDDAFIAFNRLLSFDNVTATFCQILNMPGFDRGYDREKALLIGSPHQDEAVVLERANLLCTPLPDKEKATLILTLAQVANRSGRGLLEPTLAFAAVTLQDEQERNRVLAVLNASGSDIMQKAIRGMELTQKAVALGEVVRGTGYDALFSDAISDYIADGLPLGAIHSHLLLLERTGQDPGNFASIVMPAYRDVVEYALKHPDRLVHAGYQIPTPGQVREQFKTNATQIINAIILVGAAPLKQAIFQKKLDRTLEVLPKILESSAVHAPLYGLSKYNQNPFQLVKLLELVHGFVAEFPQYPIGEKLAAMAETKKLDIPALGSEYLKQFFHSIGIEVDTITETQLEAWNMEYINFLAQAFRNCRDADGKAELERLCAETLKGNYWGYIEDPSHRIGAANAKTRKMFAESFKKAGVVLDYDAWLHYDGVVSFDSITGQNVVPHVLKELSNVYRILEGSLSNQAKTEFSKNLARSGCFVLKENGDIAMSEDSDAEAGAKSRSVRSNALYHLLDSVLRSNALSGHEHKVLDLRKHLESLQYMIKQLDNDVPPEPMEVKLWQRQPGYDLFQGVYTGACTALGSGSMATPEALEHTFVQIAELRNKASGQTVGKALFFWSKDMKTGEPILILNTFEGRGKHSSSCEHNPYVRDKVMEFARAYGERVAGRPVPILIGRTLNPLYVADMGSQALNVQVIGKVKNDKFYLDALPGSTGSVSQDHFNVSFYKPRGPLIVPEEKPNLTLAPVSAETSPAAPPAEAPAAKPASAPVPTPKSAPAKKSKQPRTQAALPEEQPLLPRSERRRLLRAARKQGSSKPGKPGNDGTVQVPGAGFVGSEKAPSKPGLYLLPERWDEKNYEFSEEDNWASKPLRYKPEPEERAPIFMRDPAFAEQQFLEKKSLENTNKKGGGFIHLLGEQILKLKSNPLVFFKNLLFSKKSC